MAWYKFICKPSGLLLDRKKFIRKFTLSGGPVPGPEVELPIASGHMVQLWEDAGSGATNQNWTVIPYGDTGWSRIISRENERFDLDARAEEIGNNGCPIQVWSHDAHGVGANALWQIVPVPERGGVIIRNRVGWKTLNAYLPDVKQNGCKVQLYDPTGGDNEIWVMEQVG